MTEPPPPWALPRPSDVPPRRPEPPVRPESSAEPEPELEPESPPLFPSDARLFPGGPARPRTREELPDPPRGPRRVRTDAPARTGEAASAAGEAVPSAPAGPPPGRRPPPMRQQAEVPDTDPGAPDTDPRVGVIAGPFENSRRRPSYPGTVVLIVASVLMIATVIGRALSGDAPIALVAVPVVLIAGIGVARRLTRGDGDLTVPVRRFEVQPAAGRARRVVLDGEIDPDALNPGDIVRIHGDRERDGHVVATSVDVLATLSGPVVRQVTGREPRPVVAARVLTWISIALAVLLVGVAAMIVVRP
jgi:hypothetical protein